MENEFFTGSSNSCIAVLCICIRIHNELQWKHPVVYMGRHGNNNRMGAYKKMNTSLSSQHIRLRGQLAPPISPLPQASKSRGVFADTYL